MKVFITGIAGFLGSHLADWFIERGHYVTGCDSLFGGELSNVPRLAKFHRHDITNLDGYAKLMEGCDVVYHCAAVAYEGVSVYAPAFVSHNIYTGSAVTFSAAIQAGAKRIINCSSMARYGKGISPFVEGDAAVPVDPYGIAKLSAERLLHNLATTHGFEYVIAVPHNIYGPRQKYDDPYRNVASIMANLMLQGRAPIIYGDGKQRRCFSYISDVTDPLGMMATSKKAVGKVINVGPDDEPVTINDLAERLANITGCNLPPIYMPGRPQEVKHATCSAMKARKLLNYKSQVPLDEGLRHLVDWIKQNGPKPFNYHFGLEFTDSRTPKTWTDRMF